MLSGDQGRTGRWWIERGAATTATLTSAGDSALGQVIGGHLDGDLVAGEDADVVHPHLAGDVCEDFVAGLQLRPESGVGQSLGNDGLDGDRFFLRHRLLLGTAFGGTVRLGPGRVAAGLSLALA